ncbi:MAG TPA: CehA/McbA family metallohydrolase, partial [Polyangia bacterium]
TPPPPVCPGSGASAGTIAGATDPHHIGGPGAAAMTGDFYLQNDKVRFVVQQPGRHFAPVPEGGNIIDADLVRGAGEPGADELGELTGFLSGTVYTIFDSLEVKQDGSAGGPAVIQGDGRVDMLEYMNLPAILGDNPTFARLAPNMAAFADKLIPNIKVRVTYALCPGESAVRVRYTLFNDAAPNAPDLKPSVGTFLQGAGESSAFMSGFGFGPRSAGEGFSQGKPGTVFGLLGRRVAYAQRPYRWYDALLTPTDYGSDDCAQRPNTCSSQVTVSGLTITAFGEGSPLAMLTPDSADHEMVLKGKTGSTFELLLGMGRDLAEAQAAVTQLDRALGDVSGTVSAAGGLPAETRVAVFKDYDATDADQVNSRKVVSAFDVAQDGTYGGKLLPGAYVFEVDAPGRPRKDQRVTVAADAPVTVPAFSLDATRTINYQVTAGGQPTACRISVIGKAGDLNTGIRSNQHRDTLVDTFPPGLAYVEVSSVCDSGSTAPGAAGVIEVVPGTYRIVVSRGPEFSILDQRDVDLTTTTTVNVTGDLVRAMRTDGWAAIDLHQHAYYSFDARVTHERRLTSYLAEGVDFFGASEHDHIYDYADLIAQMGFEDRLATMTGTEISPMHYGHFNAFELIEDKNNPITGGAPDWSGGPNSTVIAPDALLGMAMSAGADLISANHTRAPDGWTGLYWWDRCGLSIDLATGGAPRCDPLLQAVPNDMLNLPPGATLWSDKWHLLEMFNRPTPICRRLGYSPQPGHETEVIPVAQPTACSADGANIYWCDPDSPDGGRVFDAQVDANLMDWLNMLQVGYIRTVVGNSDSHKVVAEQAGLPRSYVLVGAGHDSASDPSLKSLLKAALLPAPTATPPRLAGAVVAGNGPFVTVTVVGQKGGAATSAGIGGIVEDDDGTVDVQVHLEAPDWMMGAGRIELFANDAFPDNYTEAWVKDRPAWRNDTKNVEPVLAPSGRTIEFAATDWTVVSGRRFIDRTLTVTPVGPTERDAWIVVRVTGDKPMYPVLPDFSCFRPEDDPAHAGTEPFFGTTAIAVTNPVFVLQNGHTSWKAPAAP